MIVAALVSYIIIVILVILEHQFWGGRPELVRRGIGITTVLGITAIPAYLLGFIWGWALTAVGFFIAGATLALFKVQEDEAEHQRKLSGVIDERFPTKGNH